MKPRVALLLFAALPLFAQPQINTLAETSGPTAGNTYLHILGSNLIGAALLCPSPICSDNVAIAGGGAPIVAQSKNELVVLVPPHASAGPATIHVNIAGHQPFDFENAFRYNAFSETDYERILLPVVTNTKGALGSDWRTMLLIHNGSNQPFTPVGACTQPLPLARCGPDLIVPAHQTLALPVATDQGNPSAFIHIPHALKDDVDITIRVQDVSRQALTWGTSIPAVRAEQFRRVVRLHDIPTDDRFRAALRVYGYDTVSRPVTIDIYDQSTHALIVSTQLNLAQPTFFADDPPPAAAYAQISSLADAFPQIRTHERIEIEVASAFLPQPPIWAFISVTNNDTQHVTTIAP